MLKFDILLNHSCNFRCKYCFEQNSKDEAYTSKTMSFATIDRMITYILTVCPDEPALLCFFGGEPLLSIDKIVYIAEKVKAHKNISFNIVSNGALVNTHKDKFLHMKEIMPHRIFTAISYDYALQDNRQVGSYEIVRDAIRWLRDNQIPVCTISVLQVPDMPKYYELVKDYNLLKNELGRLDATFNVDRSTCSQIHTYENQIIDSINKAKEENLTLIPINAACESGGEDPRCFFANVYCGIDCDGSLWPTQNAVYHSDIQKQLMSLGNVHDSFASNKKRREYVFSQLPTKDPKECCTCNTGCRRYKWRSIETSYAEYNRKQTDDICYTYHLLNKCFNE